MYCLTSVIASSIFLYLESMTSFTNLMLSAQCVILNLDSRHRTIWILRRRKGRNAQRFARPAAWTTTALTTGTRPGLGWHLTLHGNFLSWAFLMVILDISHFDHGIAKFLGGKAWHLGWNFISKLSNKRNLLFLKIWHREQAWMKQVENVESGG